MQFTVIKITFFFLSIVLCNLCSLFILDFTDWVTYEKLIDLKMMGQTINIIIYYGIKKGVILTK